jgi:hypothetical protein
VFPREVWKRDYSGSVRRLIRNGADTPLASLFVHAARTVPEDAGGARRARNATKAFLYRRLDILRETNGRFRVNVALSIPFDGRGTLEVDLLCAEVRVATELDGGQHLGDPWRTVAIRAKIGCCRRTATSCGAFSPRRWVGSWMRCSM